MAETMTLKMITSLGGKTGNSQIVAEGDGIISKSVTLPAAKTGNLTTRTDDNTGVLTMDTGHGITTGQRLDVYWVDGDGVDQVRYGMTVGTVATNSVPIDGGAGAVLPADEYEITAMVPVSEVFLVDGDTVKGIEIFSNRFGTVILMDDAPAAALVKSLGGSASADNRMYAWMADLEATNPIVGDNIESVYFSHGEITAAEMRVQVLTD